eukprot:tig00001038_g6518.t1
MCFCSLRSDADQPTFRTMPDEHPTLIPAPADVARTALVPSFDAYRQVYDRSLRDPEGFWADVAQSFYWHKKWDQVCSYNFDLRKGPIEVQWFLGAETNITYNCLDRHLAERGDQVALIFEGNNLGDDGRLTYRQLHEQVCKFANVLKANGVQRGDRVAIYLPWSSRSDPPPAARPPPPLPPADALNTHMFGGFSAEAVAVRVVDAQCKLIITADAVYRGAKPIPLKAVVDKSCDICTERGFTVERVIVYERLGSARGGGCAMKAGRDVWWHEETAKASPVCEPVWMDSEEPLFMLYTSGSTGTPKGVLHTIGGYMVYATTTVKYVFDIQPGDVYWCTADCGWITGHSYVVYGPLCAGTTSIVFEGVPSYPDPGRCWQVCDKFNVTKFYTAPTAIRALMREGDSWPKKHSRKSLKVLGTVGEPINPDAWLWYYNVVGDGRCPIVDTWWQTETGGHMITGLPGAIAMKPGSASLPFYGVEPVVLNEKGEEVQGECSGYLALKRPWPGIMRTVYGDHARYEQTYFSTYKGYYFTGDGCRRDADGYYWITGRVDDVINVSGHRIGTAEVENALVGHPGVAEAAVVGFPHDLKGQGIFCYVTPKEGANPTIPELKDQVRKMLGPIATPDIILLTTALPKTRSGKIMRRILRKIACNEADQLGDVSTLADPKVVDVLISLVKSVASGGKQ